jgi:hypothetical protein
MLDLSLKPTVGLVGGPTVQFAEGRWPDEIGGGVALSEEAFELVEPHVRRACPAWTEAHRYGVFELPRSARAPLVSSLRSEAIHLRSFPDNSEGKTELFDSLADWLARRCDEGDVSILGV